MPLRIIKTEKYDEIKKAVEINNGYCPCVPEGMRTENTKCMCKEFREKFLRKELGRCVCGMFEIVEEQEERTETHPARYCGKYECWDVLKDRLEHKKFTPFQAFLYGCIFKYVWRMGEKDELKKEIDKTHNYLDRLEKEL